ncbi:hypothetical protein [Sphingomonas kyeonggiensis]|uniref:Novel STAND NTPase 3 domain-containing protein n=1 Tax=Sphingomonas kyeonggiensis TaxID=1268553 RepID=A0A7W6JWC4_9SPHN|nr:hypothetical protein [Sphingomonas kyeonggiensis]MBB4100755.1 hypothetical protein [Sphingomonas kyeonggiensis]
MSGENVGGGADAQAGLDYQIDVSIWFALDLILARRLADSIELEPASQEDLEADLDEDEAGPIVSQSRMAPGTGAYRLVVQAKLRSGDPWRVSDMVRLLQHGTRRVPPAARLAESDIRYLLVTSAALSGGAKALRIHQPAVWPQAALPSDIAAILPPDAAGRVAVLSNYEPDRIETRIKELLTEAFRVPFALWESCRDALRAGAHSRVRRTGTNIWTRADLVAIVAQHEGYFASSPDLDDFVHPTNWSELKRLIADRHAAMIVGQSGTGKTLSTDMLFDELSADIPGLRRKRARTPEDIRHYREPGPVLFDIEDPWGRYSFDAAGRDWIDQLHGFMAGARADRIVVATSRLDVGRDAKALARLEPWAFALESEHYGAPERRQLYRRRVDRLRAFDVRLLASLSEQRVLDELQTPLEIQKFFDAMRLVEPDEARDAPDVAIRAAISRAHETSIEATIAQQIEARSDVKAAAVLWGLLIDRQSISFEDLGIIEDGLARADRSMERGIAPLASFLVAARNFRQKDNLLSIYHGRDEKGLLNTIRAHPVAARITLGRLLDLLAITPLADGTLHVERAATLLAAIKPVSELTFQPSQVAQDAIDAWLASVLAVVGADLDRQLQLAAAIGSPALVEAEIARWLLHRPRRRDAMFLMEWGPPRQDRGWAARMAASPRVKSLLERFIRERLAFGRDHYPRDFIEKAERLAGDLTPAFVDGAYETVAYGVLRSEETVFAGALRNIDACSRVLDRAIEISTPTPAEAAEWDKNWLAMENDEFSPGYVESLGDNDDGFSAREFIEAYTHELRAMRGWRALRDHPRRGDLLPQWLRILSRPQGLPEAEEMLALQPIVVGTQTEGDYWFVARQHWQGALAPALAARVTAGAADMRSRVRAVECLLTHAPDRIALISSDLERSNRYGRLADLGIELSIAVAAGARTDLTGLGLPALVLDLARLRSAVDVDEPVTIDTAVATAIAALPADSEAFRHFRTQLGMRGGVAVQTDIEWLLEHSDEQNFAVDAINCAVQQGWTDVMERATAHRFGHVAAIAVTALAPRPPTPLPREILARLDARGRPLRAAFLALLEQRPTADSIPPLLKLAADRLSNQDSHDNANSLPIARRAIAILAQHADFDLGAASTLLDIARTTDDPSLRRSITDLLATRPSLQSLLLATATARGPAALRVAAIWSLLSGR